MAIKIKDVAEYAGVSVGSVSSYLNGKELKPANMQKIKEAIEVLNYKPNTIAQSLKSRKSMSVGILIDSLTDQFAASIVEIAQSILIAHGYTVLLCSFSMDVKKQEQKLMYLLDKKVDGAILYLSGDYLPTLEEFTKQNKPLVLINEDIKDLYADKILVNNSEAGFRATEKLIQAGHKNIAIVLGARDDYTGVGRLDGYKKALKYYGLEPNEDLIMYAKYDFKIAYEMVKKILESENPPTAIFATSYHLTIGAVIAINELDLKIPTDISIIGFDHFELSDVIKPQITLVEQPIEQIGVLAAETLLKRLSGDLSSPPKRIELNTNICARNSIANIRESEE